MAIGCCEFCSRDEIREIISSFSNLLLIITSVTTGLPCVSVPVLSNTTVSIIYIVSRADAFLKSIPFFAPWPVPTIIATGVANPRAQGHDITNTEMAKLSANSKS